MHEACKLLTSVAFADVCSTLFATLFADMCEARNLSSNVTFADVCEARNLPLSANFLLPICDNQRIFFKSRDISNIHKYYYCMLVVTYNVAFKFIQNIFHITFMIIINFDAINMR